MKCGEVSLSPSIGEVATSHTDQVELIESHAGYKGNSIIATFPLVNQLPTGITI